MLKVVRLTLLLVLASATAGLAQETGTLSAPTSPLTKKDVSSQGSATQASSGAADKSTALNKTAGTEGQPPSVPPTVKCAIKLSASSEQSVTSAEWLKLATDCHNSGEDNSDKNPTAGLNDRLFLLVSFGDGQSTVNRASAKIEDWRLSINGVGVDDTKLSWEAGDDKMAVLSAKLKRTDSSKASWNELLTQKLTEHTVPVTITDATKKPFPSEAYFNLKVIQLKWYGWILFVILLVLLIVLLTQDRLREMLREDGPWKTNPTDPNARAAYSLSRVQMFYWFSIVVVCYVVIWIVTGDRDTVNSDVLALIGISAGTFLGAVAIDSSKKAQAQSDLPDATAKLEQVQTTATSITAAAGAASPAAVAATEAVAAQQRAVNQLNGRTLADCNENFLTDILSDEDGLSFHRFQIFAWSLVLGVIFVASVVQTLDMPTFGNTLLGLMGISGGTYLGFKFPEQKTK